MLKHKFLKNFHSARISAYGRQFCGWGAVKCIPATSTRLPGMGLEGSTEWCELTNTGAGLKGGTRSYTSSVSKWCTGTWPRYSAAGKTCRARRTWRTGVTRRPGYRSDQTRPPRSRAASRVRAWYKPVARGADEPRTWRIRYTYWLPDEQVVSADVPRKEPIYDVTHRTAFVDQHRHNDRRSRQMHQDLCDIHGPRPPLVLFLYSSFVSISV